MDSERATSQYRIIKLSCKHILIKHFSGLMFIWATDGQQNPLKQVKTEHKQKQFNYSFFFLLYPVFLWHFHSLLLPVHLAISSPTHQGCNRQENLLLNCSLFQVH